MILTGMADGVRKGIFHAFSAHVWNTVKDTRNSGRVLPEYTSGVCEMYLGAVISDLRRISLMWEKA